MKTEQTITNKGVFLYSPELLWEYSQAYFKSIDEVNKGAHKLKPYSQTGLAKYLGISYPTWTKAKGRFQEQPDFMDVLQGIQTIINVNQLEGAMIGIFPACILNETFWNKYKLESK